MTKPPSLPPKHEEILRSQVFDQDHPGTILRDFHTVLDYIGPEGVESSGKYHLLPLGSLQELDSKLSRPLRLKLERPQLRSHPYLQGLHLLLRATGLVRVERKGAKSWLVPDPVLRARWYRLNPTEQYFNLLEAWLLHGRAEMIGESEGYGRDHLMDCSFLIQYLPAKGYVSNQKKPQYISLPTIGRNFYTAALLDLFGLLSVTQPATPAAHWLPARVDHAPFGDALFSLLQQEEVTSSYDLLEDREDREEETKEEAPAETALFGDLQPFLQPYFPAWKENLTAPVAEFREGLHVFRVSLGKIWRRIAVPADTTLHDLLLRILNSVGFDYDHLYAFTYTDEFGARVTVGSPEVDGEDLVGTEVPIGSLPIQVGETMALVYDFGDNWRFTVKLETVDPKSRVKVPKVLEKHGKAPQQYPSWE